MRPLRLISQHFSKTPKTLFQDFKPISNLKPLNLINEFSSSTKEAIAPNPSPEVGKIVEELSGLTLIEISDLTDVLRNKLALKEMPLMMVMMPGMGFSGVRVMEKGSGGGAASKVAEEKAEKTAFDVKLEAFDAAAKIKVIKEVRACTSLGLKEAKDLVEKAPTLLMKGVPKEEAEKIIQKLKEIGATATMD